MTEQKSKAIMVNSIMLIAIITAYICRFIGKGAFYPTFFTYLRGFIYIGLFTMWGIFVRQRVVQKQAKKYLTWVAVLLIFWMMVRSAKYFIFWQAAAIRYTWYLFYLPMIFVPMLALLIALSLGKPDDYRLPKAPFAIILWQARLFRLWAIPLILML